MRVHRSIRCPDKMKLIPQRIQVNALFFVSESIAREIKKRTSKEKKSTIHIYYPKKGKKEK